MSSIRSQLCRLGVAGLLAAGLFVTGAGTDLQAQVVDRPHFGIGYVANAPDMMAGVSGYVLWPVLGGLGIYVDTKFDIDSPEEDTAFRSDVTNADILANSTGEYSGAQYVTDEWSFRSFNIAVVRPMSSALFFYGGGGIAKGKRYYLYSIPQGEDRRALMVAAPDEDEDRLNLMAGVMLRISSVLSSQIGYETQPNGVTAGVSIRLPAW